MGELKPYAEYKDSGLEWLGQIPAHWQTARSKRLFSPRKELARPDDVQLSATQAFGVIPQSLYEERTGYRIVKISMHLDKRRHVEADDFVISMRSFQGGLERAWSSGAIRSSYVVLKPGPEVDPSYFRHFFKSAPYISALRITADFIRDGQDLNYSNFCGVDVPLIPRDEQAVIGRYLDWANGRLDRAIRAKRKVIALLTKQKQAIVQRAVNRGLEAGPALVDSGIPWLGSVPQHWTIRRLRTLVHRVDQGVSPLAVGFLASGADLPSAIKVVAMFSSANRSAARAGARAFARRKRQPSRARCASLVARGPLPFTPRCPGRCALVRGAVGFARRKADAGQESTPRAGVDAEGRTATSGSLGIEAGVGKAGATGEMQVRWYLAVTAWALRPPAR